MSGLGLGLYGESQRGMGLWEMFNDCDSQIPKYTWTVRRWTDDTMMK